MTFVLISCHAVVSLSPVLGRFLKYWVPLILWMFVIFGASTGLGSSEHTSRFVRPFLLWLFPHISEEALNTVHFCVRKAGHLSEFALLAILWWRALRSEPRIVAARTLRAQFALVILICALYAASDEFHQSFSATREARVTDVMIDTFGASMGALFFWGVLWACKRKK